MSPKEIYCVLKEMNAFLKKQLFILEFEQMLELKFPTEIPIQKFKRNLYKFKRMLKDSKEPNEFLLKSKKLLKQNINLLNEITLIDKELPNEHQNPN
jgi:hypothetical protein